MEVNVINEGYLPGCTKFGFQCALTHDGHQCSQLCLKGQQHCLQHSTTQDIILAHDFAPDFRAGDTTLDLVPSFKYLGHWMLTDNNDTMAVTQNICKAQIHWGQLLMQCGASCRVMGLFYKVTVQAVLLHGAETSSILM